MAAMARYVALESRKVRMRSATSVDTAAKPLRGSPLRRLASTPWNGDGFEAIPARESEGELLGGPA
jgi:hypothetical protein